MTTRVLIIAVGLVLAGVLAVHASLMGDTLSVVDAAQAAFQCAAHGRWTGCTQANQWPLFQFLPSLAMVAAGLSRDAAATCLCWLNIAAFAGLTLLALRSLKTTPVVGWISVLVLLSGPYLAYANQSFGEVLAGFLTAAFAVAWMRRASGPAIAVLIFFAAITKETSFPFLALLGFICAMAPWAPGMRAGEVLRAEWGRLLGAFVGISLAAAATMLFNVFRFSTPLNVDYLQQAPWAPSLSDGVQFVAAQWIAPNLGLLFFWPLLLVALGSALLVGLRTGGPGRLATPGVLLLLLLVCVGLARWWAPFGWWAWGSRLILPWLPACLLVALHARVQVLEPFFQRLLAPAWTRVALVFLVVIVGLPHLIDAVQTHRVNGITFVEKGVCPVPSSPAARVRYYDCIRRQTWRDPSPLLTAARMLNEPKSRNTALVYLLLVGGIGLHLGRRIRPREAEQLVAGAGQA
jgi:hypothetical protein